MAKKPVIADVYLDRAKKPRWRMRHLNITANGGEVFASLGNSKRAIRQLVHAIRTREVRIHEPSGKVTVLEPSTNCFHPIR